MNYLEHGWKGIERLDQKGTSDCGNYNLPNLVVGVIELEMKDWVAMEV